MNRTDRFVMSHRPRLIAAQRSGLKAEGCVIGVFDGCQTCIALDTLTKPKEGDPS